MSPSDSQDIARSIFTVHRIAESMDSIEPSASTHTPWDNTNAKKSPVASSLSTYASSSFVWGRPSRAKYSLLQARAKDLESKMFYGPGFDPPVNNVIVPNIFNKLDAHCKERTRVINSVLDKRLDVQEKVLLRNKDLSQKVLSKQTAKLKEDLRKISKRLPSFSKLYKNTDMELLERQVKQSPVHFTRVNVSLPEERQYCFRYFEHHNPVRIARRVAEGMKRDLKRLEQSMEGKQLSGDSGNTLDSGQSQLVAENTETTETTTETLEKHVIENDSLDRKENLEEDIPQNSGLLDTPDLPEVSERFSELLQKPSTQ